MPYISQDLWCRYVYVLEGNGWVILRFRTSTLFFKITRRIGSMNPLEHSHFLSNERIYSLLRINIHQLSTWRALLLSTPAIECPNTNLCGAMTRPFLIYFRDVRDYILLCFLLFGGCILRRYILWDNWLRDYRSYPCISKSRLMRKIS